MAFPRVTATLIALITLAAPALSAPAAPAEKRELIAKVNGEAVYLDQLQPLIQEERKTFVRMGAKTGDPTLEARLRERALEKYLTQFLLEKEAAKVKVPDLEKKLQERLKELPHKTEADKMELARENLRRQIRLEEYFRRNGLSEPEVPEAEVRAYYEKNKTNFMQKEKVEVRHILATVAPDAGEKEVAQAKAKIEKARKELEKGKAFEEVAEKLSDCNSAKGGGQLGPIERGYMPPEFEKVAFSLPPNKLSPTVRTKFGFHLMEVTARHEAGSAPFDKMKDFLTKYLQQQKASGALNSHLAKLRKQARIETVPAKP